MWDYIINNKEWIFSGIGVMVLTLLISLFKNKKNNAKNLPNKNEQDFSKNSIANSTFNNITGENINFHHTLNTNINTGFTNKEPSDIIPIIDSPLLHKTKQDYITDKTKMRTFIYAIVSPSKNSEIIIEIRTVTDSAEDILKIKSKPIIQELKEMEDEGLIELVNPDSAKWESPYTRIVVTKKFFTTIKDPKY